MKKLITISTIAIAVMTAAGCSSATYRVRDPVTNTTLQSVQASAPGGDTFVLVVYYGSNQTPIIQAGGDSSALVEATAAAGRRAVDIALRLAKVP